MLATNQRAAADQIARALHRLGYVPAQGKAAMVFGSYNLGSTRYTIGAYLRGTNRAWVWGWAPNVPAAFEVGEGLQRLIGRRYSVWVRPPGGIARSYSDLLERTV